MAPTFAGWQAPLADLPLLQAHAEALLGGAVLTGKRTFQAVASRSSRS